MKHAGWTWGSVGAVYAETPNRIWIAMRGELPLPAGAKPWTPYALLNPRRGNATGNPRWDQRDVRAHREARVGAALSPRHLRPRRRRQHGRSTGRTTTSCSKAPCGRGPHKIKMSPYDPEKHVWVFDDQLHVIHKFTYDGKLVMTLGTRGQRGRDAGKLFDRPTDIDWLPDGTFFISDGYGGKRVAKFDKDGKFLMDWGATPKDPANPGPNEWNTVHSIAISQGPPDLRRRPRTPPLPDLRRERQVPRHVLDRRCAPHRTTTSSRPTRASGCRTAGRIASSSTT